MRNAPPLECDRSPWRLGSSPFTTPSHSVFTTRAIAAGEELTIHYGGKYDDWRDYPVGRQTTVTCPRNLTSLFPDGIPWSALALITDDMIGELEPRDRGDDGEWRPSRRRRR